MRITPCDNVLVRKMGTEAVLLNVKKETYYMLNSTGIRIWEVLTTSDSLDAALAILNKDYAIADDTLRADVQELIQSLQAADLITVDE